LRAFFKLLNKLVAYKSTTNYDLPMKNRFLHLLMIWIALQSTVAMADFYQPHHSEEEHIQTIKTHSTLTEDELLSHQPNFKDINHSCHHFCSVNTMTFIELDCLFTQNFQLSKQLETNFRNKNHLWIILPKDLRPPIA